MTDHPMYPGTPWNDTVLIAVFDGDIWDCPFWNHSAHGSLAMFRKWLDEQIATIPPEFLHTADIDINSVGGHEGEHHVTIAVSYSRPMTPREISERDSAIKRRDNEAKSKRLAEYNRLKAEFDAASPKP